MKTRTFKIGDVSITAIDGQESGARTNEDWMRRPLTITPKVEKAFQRKDKSSEPVKKVKTDGKATSKKAGKNGKTRYGYPADKNQAGKKKKASEGSKAKTQGDGAGKKKEGAPQQQTQEMEEKGADPIAVPRQPNPKSADPQQLANQMQIPVQTLQHIAARFVNNPKLGGREGFANFWMSRAKEFAEKHKLDADYFGLLFDALTGAGPTQATKVH